MDTKSALQTVSKQEIDWMLSKRPLKLDLEQLITDYGRSESEKITREFKEKGFSDFIPCLNYPGVGTRWQEFLSWLQSLSVRPNSTNDAFEKFAVYLGRVISYRALSLTPEGYQRIIDNDSIWPSGQLRTSAENLAKIVDKYGVKYVAVARLYIGRRLLQFDPSLSLHDDPETAVCIAGGYIDTGKRIHLMGLSVPKIEHLGYKVADIQDNKAVWFPHRGIWFNSTWERTERYCLWEIPFFSSRKVSERIFQTNEEIEEFLKPFKEKMEKLKVADIGSGDNDEDDM